MGKGTTSGPSLTDERRAELGFERISLRPPAGTRKRLAQLAKRLGCSQGEALAKAVALALAGALLAACTSPTGAPEPMAISAAADEAVVSDAPSGAPIRTGFTVCTSNPVVLEAIARWDEALALVPSPYGASQPDVPAIRPFCGMQSLPVWFDPGLYGRSGHGGWYQGPAYIIPGGALILDPAFLTVPMAMHELGHALGLGHLSAGVMLAYPEATCIDEDAAARIPGAHATCAPQ